MTDKFVSRAGEKLQFALENFNISVKDYVVADFGSSTGGFVDCLLQNGAKKVYAVDAAYGELAWELRNDTRVIVLERINAMHVKLPEKVDLITIDVAWTKQEKVIPNALENLRKDGLIISLIKPHYEAERYMLREGKLADEYLRQVLEEVKKVIISLGGEVLNIIESPILGVKGHNKEFLALIKRL